MPKPSHGSGLKHLTFAIGSVLQSSEPDKERRAQRWHYPGASGASLETTTLSYNGTPYMVHNNAFVSIVPTNVCTDSCGFCVIELLKKPEHSHNKHSTETSVGAFIENLHKALEFLAPIKPALTITGGGEPTISPRLPAALEAISGYPFAKLVINTNGSRLLEKAAGERFLQDKSRAKETVLGHLLAAGLDHLNLSFAHFDSDINAKLMSKPALRAVPDLKEITRQAQAANCRPRLSVILLKDGIADITGLKRYLDWAAENGIDDVLVREVAGFDRNSVRQTDTISYAEQQRVPLDALLLDVERDNSFRFVRQKSGKSHYREDYIYQNEIQVGFAAYRLFTREESLRDSGTIKWLVLQPTGALNTGWETWDQNIIPESTRDA
jgi:molybdenum cofactor biosynthesis enzyme MoaA